VSTLDPRWGRHHTSLSCRDDGDILSKELIELIADLSFTDQEWAKLTAGDPVHFELRLKRPFYTDETLDGEPVSGDTWIIAAAYADKTETGTVKGVLGCLTDISRQKWAEDFQARRTDEAIELKRQQENFMDMTSHEARNPLSAITLCAESILTTLKELLNTDGDIIHVSRDTIETHHEGAEISTKSG
jgi:signal transduction histidine kinase